MVVDAEGNIDFKEGNELLIEARADLVCGETQDRYISYIRLCSPEFVETLYQTAIGFAAVLSAIAIYLFAAWWGSRIIRIEV